jgi:hypothetical protein
MFSEARDPSYGLKSNKLCRNRKVSRCLYQVDIGSTPQIVRDLFDRVDINGEAWLANSGRGKLDKKLSRFNGRY